MNNSFLNQFDSNIKFNYYIYFHDGLLGGPCYLKISSYPPVSPERAVEATYNPTRTPYELVSQTLKVSQLRLAMAGAVCHSSASSTSTDTRIKYGLRPACFAGFNQAGNAIQLQLDKKGIGYRMKDNAFVEIDDPEALQEIATGLNGRLILNRIKYCLPALPAPYLLK